MPLHPRRAILFIPGDDEEKIQFAAKLAVDSICLDLESSVVPSGKANARALASRALRTLDFGTAERLVRINPLQSNESEKDLQAVLPAQPDGIIVPLVENAAQLQWVSRKITAAEEANGWQPGRICLLAALESTRAIINLPQICTADTRLVALLLGADGLALDMGALRTPAALELLYARSALVLHAAAFGLQAIDMPNNNFHDLHNLREEARQAAELGFLGKQVVHPDQVQPVQEIFTLDQKVIADAQRILTIYAEHQAQGVGQFESEGMIIDARLVRSAESLLARAQAAGMHQPPPSRVSPENEPRQDQNWLQNLWNGRESGDDGQGR